MSDLQVGQTVRLNDGRTAVVRFVGPTLFAPSEWVGVELDDDTGKNDGAVQGERYFDCPPGRGMFIRPTAVASIQAAPVAAKAVPARKPSRASSVVPGSGRQSAVNDPSMNKRMSLNAPSPSPVPRTSRPSSIARSPTKSPTKQLTSTATSSAATSRTGTPANARVSSIGTKPARPSTIGSRMSMGPPALPASSVTRKPSITGSAPRVTPSVTRPAAGRISSVGGRGGLSRPVGSRVTSGGSGSGTEGPSGKSDSEATNSPVRTRTKALEKATTKATASTTGTTRTSAAATATNTSRPGQSTAASRENEDLKAKLKVLERKRLEDREKIQALEKAQERGDKFETINKKIEAKFQSTNQENVDMRKQLKEALAQLEQIESLQAEHDSIMELATLDREMAEETAEVLKVELEALKQKTEELELEVEILREENEEYSQGMTPEERTSTSWLQLERTNERLREALIRLRDLTRQQDEEQRAQIKELQSDLEEFEAVKEQYEIAKETVLELETRAEDLRQQLDDNLGAEAMIEQLSYEKLGQTEQINELKAVIEDLEALKEINDELEINHVQHEREMQDDLDFKDSIIAEQLRRSAQQDETLEDLEYTLSRFRELVTNLQTDLEDMRASHAVNEAESEQINSKTRAMMDLNQKLRISAEKTQLKTIDLELQRMNAQESQQHLQIVKLFLPETFDEDRDSVLALLRFKRLAFKAGLLHGFIKDRVNGQTQPGHEDDVFAGCDAMDKLTWVSSMCNRFVNAISHCSLEEFAKYEGALYELEPVERALNGWIDGLKHNELKEQQCANELQRTVALMTHLGEVHISEGLESFADEVQMRTSMMHSHLESASTVMSVVKDLVARTVPAAGEDDELADHFNKKSDAVVTLTRSAKVVVSKALRSLEDLQARSLCLTPETAEVFEQCESASQELAEMSRVMGSDLHALLTEEGRTEPATYADVQSTISKTAMQKFSSSESDIFSTYLSKLRTLTSQITDLAAVCSDLSHTQEFERSDAPWNLRAEEIKAAKTIPVDAEEEMRQLKEQANEKARQLAVSAENLSTANLRIQTLEARMNDAKARADRISGLEQEIENAKEHAAGLQRNIEEQDRELKTLEADRDQWKKIAGDSKAFAAGNDGKSGGNKAGQERAVATAREMDALKQDIASLQAAVRYLREDNRRARLTEQSKHDWLTEPLRKPAPAAEQRRALVTTEGKDALGELLKMATNAKVYDLRQLPKDKLAWRPAKSTPQYHAAKQAEDYAAWKGWQEAVAHKATLVLSTQRSSRLESSARDARKRPVAARLQIRLPGLNGKGTGAQPGSEVQIVGSSEWEGLQGRRVAAL
ncbi:dynactin [Microdochium bolleyi]|uniref:Dynactin n=1 Tax=Microdochium bolleyi TaxID=196109 RepID=A0A136IXE8_9PEZI|nr:dynactin [Microdochium bolleyi]